jgi:hypothetical protein
MTSPHPELESDRPDKDGAAHSESAGADAGGVYAAQRKVAAVDEARLSLMVLRDVAVVSVLLSIFAAAESWATVSRLGFATLLSVVDGLLVGAATTAVAHEWGHFVGARLGGGHAPLKPLTKFLPLYDFDYANNDGRAFLWMSYGGNLAHAALVLVYLAFVHTAGREGTAALVAGAFGFAVFSSLVEIPVIQQARRGVPGLEALAVIPKDFVSRYLPWALGAAFLAYAVL